MAELPEIIILARQMNRELVPSILEGIEFELAKPLNVPPADFKKELLGRRVEGVRPLGKWLVLEFAKPGPNLMIHPGMGMDLLSLGVENDKEPHFWFRFDQGRGFCVRFWWFGYLRLARAGTEPLVGGGLGPVPLSPEFTPQALDRVVEKRKGTGLKAFLLDQKNLAGIGNFYVHDICFRLGAHPRTRLAALSPDQRRGLHRAVEETLSSSVERGMNYFEYDFFGRKGDWGRSAFLVGYQEGRPCPGCGRPIEKMKIGATASYICPVCQPELK
jgi:formamidopyrimidine-DNA glycosylase